MPTGDYAASIDYDGPRYTIRVQGHRHWVFDTDAWEFIAYYVHQEEAQQRADELNAEEDLANSPLALEYVRASHARRRRAGLIADMVAEESR